MSNHWFKFKQFTIEQDECAMKVGTDAVLLGAWCEVEGKQTALDIGTGTGILSLMIAQRNPMLQVDAIDIDEPSILQAKANIQNSPFFDRISATLADFAADCNPEYEPTYINEKYDLVITNPPFYEEDTECPSSNRQAARHTSSLPFPILINKVSTILNPRGTFAVIIPTNAAQNFISLCAINKLYLKRRTDIYTTPRKQPKRTLMEFTDGITESSFSKLFMRDEANAFSEEYLSLTKDFYL